MSTRIRLAEVLLNDGQKMAVQSSNAAWKLLGVFFHYNLSSELGKEQGIFLFWVDPYFSYSSRMYYIRTTIYTEGKAEKEQGCSPICV